MIRHAVDREFGLYVRESGPQTAATTVLWVHGLGESGLCFEGLLAHPRLAHVRQLAADVPGYGKSPWTAEPPSLEAQADLLARWLAARGEGPVVLVGHSMGGVSGLMLCERHPERVRAFFNVEGNVSIEDCRFSGRAVAWDEAAFPTGGWREMLDFIYLQGVESAAMRTYFASARMCDPRLYHRNAGELVALAKTERAAPRLAALGIPLLYVLGHPEGTGELSRRLLDEAGIAWRALEPAGHWPFIDLPEAFVAVLCEFLAALGENER